MTPSSMVEAATAPAPRLASERRRIAPANGKGTRKTSGTKASAIQAMVGWSA